MTGRGKVAKGQGRKFRALARTCSNSLPSLALDVSQEECDAMVATTRLGASQKSRGTLNSRTGKDLFRRLKTIIILDSSINKFRVVLEFLDPSFGFRLGIVGVLGIFQSIIPVVYPLFFF
jgi:hypothetical protein